MGNFKNTFFFLTTIFFPIITNSTNFYIDSKQGSDLNSGLSPKLPLKTISKINQVEFSPGDSILFRRGSEWREELVIDFSGSKEKPVIISAYGNGRRPVIKGSVILEGTWKSIDDNVWAVRLNRNPKNLWFIRKGSIYWGNKLLNIQSLKNEHDFYWDQNMLYVYFELRAPEDYEEIECSKREFGIVSGWYDKGNDYIKIENLEIMFTGNSNIRAVDAEGWTVNGCVLHHSGSRDESDGQGIQYEGGNGIFSNNIIYENGQHGIFLSSFGNADVKENIIEKNTICNNYHTGIDLMNDGGDCSSHTKTIIRRNRIFDTMDFQGNEIGIQTLGYGEGFVTAVQIHHNLIYNVNGIGLSIMNNSDSILIHNNTIVNTESACYNVDNGKMYAEIINNIGINNRYYAVVFFHNSKNKLIDYNLWYTEKGSSTKNIFIDDKYFDAFEDYISFSGFDINGAFQNPDLIIKEFVPVKLSRNSICIDAGKELGYKSDFYGNQIREMIDIGAFENYD